MTNDVVADSEKPWIIHYTKNEKPFKFTLQQQIIKLRYSNVTYLK